MNAPKHYTIRATATGPKLLITAGVHGDEYEPMVACSALVDIVRKQLVAGSVTIIPIVNAGAYAARKRVGDDGLDLARICPGNKSGSGSEQAAAFVSEAISEADFYIDLHTGGKEFSIYPLAGYMLHATPKVLVMQQEMAKAFNLEVIWGTDSALEGRTLSVARDKGVPAIYVEYGGGEPFRSEVVDAYIEGCLNIMSMLKLVVPKRSFTPRNRYWLEDYTPSAGHLQSKMPSPMKGIFIPEVVLGQEIKKGQQWGTLVDIESREEKTVYSEANGMVLFVRATSVVDVGNSLGGVLPVYQPGKTVIE